MSVPCPVCGSPTTDGTVCLHCGSIAPSPAVAGASVVPPPPPGAVPVAGLAPPVGAVPVVPVVAVDAGTDGIDPRAAVPVAAVPVVAVPVDGTLPPAEAVLPVPAGTPVALVPIAAPTRSRSAAGRAVAWGVLAAVLISAAWVGGYLFSDRNQEAGRAVTAAQTGAAPGTAPTDDSTVASAPPTDTTDLTDQEFYDQGFQPPETLPSTPPTVPITPVPVSGGATCEAPPGVDSAGAAQTYEVGRAFDGAQDTAWRCAGDASGQTVTFDLGQPVLLTSVGLVPGYDKVDPVDGSDRFVQGRTIVRARWVFDDGSSVDVTPDGARGMQSTPVQVTTQTVQLQIVETRPGATITDNAGTQWGAVDATAVSEVEFQGLTY